MPNVSAFTAMARTEFLKGMMAANNRPFPPELDNFTTEYQSNVKIETHVYMSALPRLALFKGYTPAVRLENKEYTIANKVYRVPAVSVRREDIDDDQVQGYRQTIQGMAQRAQTDARHIALAYLAAGTTNLCFDGTAMFANSHNWGSGDNLDTANYASNDGLTHKVIALRTDNSSIKPLIFQMREALHLEDNTNSSEAAESREYRFWADMRFGLGYGQWWDGYHVTITDTPDVNECHQLYQQIWQGMMGFTLPKGKDTDDTLKVHEGWVPDASNFVLLCSTKLFPVLNESVTVDNIVTAGGQKNNIYKGKAKVIATSALD